MDQQYQKHVDGIFRRSLSSWSPGSTSNQPKISFQRIFKETKSVLSMRSLCPVHIWTSQ